MSMIGQGMASSLFPNRGALSRAGGYSVAGKGHEERLTDISHTVTRILRHKGATDMQRYGFSASISFLNRPHLVARMTTLGDLVVTVRGDGGNRAERFEFGTLSGRFTRVIRAPQGHALALGVGEEALPIAGDITYACHGTSLKAAHQIVSA